MREVDQEAEYRGPSEPQGRRAPEDDERRDSTVPEAVKRQVAEGNRTQARPPTSPRRRRLVHGTLLVGGFVVLALVGRWGYQWWTHGRFVQSTNDAYLQADQVAVSTRVAGIVEKVFVGDNQPVHAGDPLVQIDDRDFRARLAQARAQADQGRAGIAQAEAQISQQEAQIAQAQAQLDGARAEARFADREAARYAQLVATGAEASERYDQMRQNRDQAHARLDQASASLLAAQRQIGALRALIQQGQAQIEQAEAQARQAQVDLESALVRASIDGRVGDRSVRVGQYVQPGTRMMSVVPVQSIYLVANFKETQVGLMRPGQPVTISVDALDGKDLRGVVDSFAPGTGAQFALIPPSNATGNFTKIVQRVPVRIRIEAGPDERQVLVPGLSVTASVDTSVANHGSEEVTRVLGKNEEERPTSQRAEAAGPAGP
jgi:membrane fusion protein (multidrug efflux system)